MYDANYVACQIPEAEDQPPNKLLFLQNLPNEITEIMLQTLFKQFPGLSEV
jgi:U2 small nuclear ribonucleoprotein B''